MRGDVSSVSASTELQNTLYMHLPCLVYAENVVTCQVLLHVKYNSRGMNRRCMKNSLQDFIYKVLGRRMNVP